MTLFAQLSQLQSLLDESSSKLIAANEEHDSCKLPHIINCFIMKTNLFSEFKTSTVVRECSRTTDFIVASVGESRDVSSLDLRTSSENRSYQTAK